MTTLLPVLRGGSLLRPFLGDFFADFSEFTGSPPTWAGNHATFRMDVAEYKDRYVLTADMAGIKKEEIEITLNDSRLSIDVKPNAEVQDSSDSEVNYILRERRIGAMNRTIVLPFATSERSIDASMKDGILTVTIKKDEALLPKKITVH